MRIAGVDFPDSLIDSLIGGGLVVFAGAGVSMGDSAGLPDFERLAEAIAYGTNRKPAKNEPLDQFLGSLRDDGIDVHTRAQEVLSKVDSKPTRLHLAIMRLFPSPDASRIVTTNFDALFEEAAEVLGGEQPDVFSAPALPLGHEFRGVIHIHGALEKPGGLVLTDEDFGRVYIVEGRTRRFLIELFQTFDVLFIGYSHEDTTMKYLTRALRANGFNGERARNRFALVEAVQVQRWSNRGAVPIPYPNTDGSFSELRRALTSLADLASRSTPEWRVRISSIADNGPSQLNEEDSDELHYALRDETFTRFFAEVATDSDWIGWLDHEGYLDNLFTSQVPDTKEDTLTRWLARNFVCEEPSVILKVISRHGGRIGPTLWNSLAHAVCFETKPELSDEHFRQWGSLLLATTPDPAEWQFVEMHHLAMASQSVKRGEYVLAVYVFDALAGSRPTPSPWFGSGTAPFRPEVVGDHLHLSEIWTSHLKSHLDMVAESLLARMHGHLTKRYEEIQVWLRMSGGLDSDSTFRPTIEPDDSDTSEEALDVLVDVARDCLDYLADHDSKRAAPWFDLFIDSEAPLLRRIGIHSVPQRSDSDADEKIEWLVQRAGLFGLPERHEIHRAMAAVYPYAGSAARKMTIELILSYEETEKEGKQHGNRLIRDRLRWLRTLADADPRDQTAIDAIESLQTQHPDVAIPQEPDTLIQRPQVFEVTELDSPYSPAELLSRRGGEWAEELLAFVQGSPSIIAKDGFEVSLKEASRQMPEWGIELATTLAERAEWNIELWQHILYFWRGDLGEELTKRVFDIVVIEELLSRHQWHIASILWGLARNGGRPYFPALLSQANTVAAMLGNYIDDSMPEFHGDYFTTAINHPSGMLAKFWMASLSTWLTLQDARPSQLPADYRERLFGIVADESKSGLLGKAVLCWQLPFLFGLDQQWTDEHLVPLLTDLSKIDRATASWHGFVYSSQYWPELLQRLETGFHEAARKMNQLFTEESRIRDHFIDRYVSVTVFHAQDPINDWIPPFFEGATESEDRKNFAFHLWHVLRRMERPEHRGSLWERLLKPYWQNRLQGVPRYEPDQAELGQMAEWLPLLGDNLAEAVALAVSKPWTWHDATILSHDMENEEISLWRENPIETASLILHVGDSQEAQLGWEWRGKGALMKSLLANPLVNQVTKHRLQELVTLLALD